MSRPCCERCNRPEKSCICPFISPVDNDVHVVVLLHPKEVNQAKGTLPLLVHSLTHCTVIEGENFSDNEALNQLLRQYGDSIALLYPSDRAKVLGDVDENNHFNNINSMLNTNNINLSKPIEETKIKCIILLDGTWKKAYRMYQLSKNLHSLKHLALPDDLVGQYAIRKTKKEYALSTLEACCYALELLEAKPKNTLVGQSKKYALLINKFVEFNTFQLSFRPAHHLPLTY
jgi:DTW domain-containing protein YfiP